MKNKKINLCVFAEFLSKFIPSVKFEIRTHHKSVIFMNFPEISQKLKFKLSF